MDCVRLGKTDMMVSKLGFGGIPIQRVSEDEAVAVVKRCLDLGINYIDTANAYTTSEGCIGKAISGRREGLFLATKTHARTGEGLESDLQLSLKRLGVKYIDLYQFHNVTNFDNLNMILGRDGAMAALEKAKRSGLVRHIGVTSHSLDMAKELVKSGHFETIMFPFNFIAREAADELLPLAREHDVGFIAMKPMAGGMLDKITLTFKYLAQFPDVLLLPGVKEEREIEEIMQIMAGPREMTAEEQAEIERIRQELGNRFCRRCDYCQPCPEEIPISTLMVTPSFAKAWPPERLFGGGMIAEGMAKAANCTKCGECEAKCPYELPIRDMIEGYYNWYEAEKKKYQEQSVSR